MARKSWLLALLVPALGAGSTAAAAPAPGTVRVGDVVAQAGATGASLTDAKIARRWSVDASGHVLGTSLADPAAGREWATSGPDFQITVDEAPTSSTTGWTLSSVVAQRAGDAGRLVFAYALPVVGSAGPQLVRTFTLHSGSAVIESDTQLVNSSPAPLRVGAASLDQITAANPNAAAEVLAYHGGSDWRDDYRVATRPPAGAFDDEGEVVRFDDGTGAGWFLVSGHRGGAMFRAQRDATGRTAVAVDWPRDAFDWGPLRTDPPDYNRTENPAYPVPVRERVVPGGSTLDLGAAYAGVYTGGAQQAGWDFADDFSRHVAPHFPRTIGANSFHPWGHGDGMSDPNLRAQIDQAAKLGIERYMLDDQWQGGTGGESGDWHFDPARFPDKDGNGTPDFVDYAHSKGVQLGLWMSPLEFNMASQTYAAHPDWACTPTGDATAQVQDDAGLGVWDVTNAAFRDYMVGVIDRLVHDYGVTEFKFDFMAWVDCAPHDYLDYEDAFVGLVREFERRHPDVTFELDETNDQRAWPFESAALGPSWFDNGHLHGSTKWAKLIHDLWTAAPWLPTSEIGIGALDDTIDAQHSVDELMPIALLSHITFWTDLTKLSTADAARVKHWLTWYRAHRATLGGAAYELTSADPIDGTSWAAFEPWRGARGALFAFRQDSADATQTFHLQGVNPATTYALTDARTGRRIGTRTGAQLAAGYDVTLGPDEAAVIAVDPVG